MYNINKEGDKLINKVGETNINSQGEKMTIIAYRCYEDIDIQFEDGTVVYHRTYGNFKSGLIKHPIKNSFAYYIENELGLNLDDVWNWKKNNENGINPYKISKCNNKKVWIYCQEHDYHNDYGGYEIRCDNFYNNRRCPYCSGKKLHWKDSLAYKYPRIAKMIAEDKRNNIKYEDLYKYSCNTKDKFYIICDKCYGASKNKKSIVNMVFQGIGCEYCSDGISIPEKFMSNILNQLNIKYKKQLASNNFKWCGYFRYDFYLPKYSMIIETNGKQHYEDNTNFKHSLYEEKMNDLFKYKCAKSHVDNYIVIDCRYSELEWLKENIIKELNGYFDLSNIDWELAWEESQNSLCIKAWELWNSGLTTSDIGNNLSLTKETIIKYLKIGKEIDKCNYSSKKGHKRAGDKRRK